MFMAEKEKQTKTDFYHLHVQERFPSTALNHLLSVEGWIMRTHMKV